MCAAFTMYQSLILTTSSDNLSLACPLPLSFYELADLTLCFLVPCCGAVEHRMKMRGLS